ncbi:MAG: hypothetical protein ACKVT0_03540 [Planctomycetaceae bacterium]
MSRDDVVARLGPPLDDKYRGGKSRTNDSYYSYGYLQMPMVPHPRTYAFLIGFDKDGNVVTKIDPFNGRFSPDGLPTTPEIIIPVDDTVFSHYPRILDCRWFPSSGVYPMTYIIELGAGQPFGLNPIYDEEIVSDVPIPFYMTTFVGGSPGRLRIKAKNEIGESDWSEYRYFRFTV